MWYNFCISIYCSVVVTGSSPQPISTIFLLFLDRCLAKAFSPAALWDQGQADRVAGDPQIFESLDANFWTCRRWNQHSWLASQRISSQFWRPFSPVLSRPRALLSPMWDGLPVSPGTTHSNLKKLAKKDWRFTKVMVNFLPCQVGLVQGENNKDLWLIVLRFFLSPNYWDAMAMWSII